MTESTFNHVDQRRSDSNGAATVTIGIIAIVAVLVLFTAGMTFLGLAIAFPIAIPVAHQFHVAVTATDAALAEQFAAFWWVFGIFSVASFVAAALVTVKAIQHLSPSPRD